MAQYSMNAYDADIYIPEFKGLMQYGDQMGGDLRFSPDCMNVETPAGVLQPASRMWSVTLKKTDGTLVGHAENFTMMYLRATHIGAQPFYPSKLEFSPPEGILPPWDPQEQGYKIYPGDEYNAYLFAVGTKLYEATIPKEIPAPYTGIELSAIYVTEKSGTFANTRWDWCTYEHVFQATLPGDLDGRANVIILSNETNGCYMYVGPYYMEHLSTPAKFPHVARFAERIWGIGTGTDDDVIYYSAVYSATNWTQNNTEPADGGGEIREATFDKDKLVALVPFGDALIAFSELRAWRITGSDPTNFAIQEQYGNGTRYPRSIAVLGDQILMLGEHGLVAYDGYRVTPFMKEATYELLRPGNVDKGTEPVGIATSDKYVLAFSKKPYTNQNPGYTLLFYDRMDGDITITDSPYITNFCSAPPDVYACTYGTDRSGIALLRSDSWHNQNGVGKTKWQTPWITLGRKDIQKGGFDLYFQPELGYIIDGVTHTGVTFTFSIQTEKKTKTKSYTVTPLTAAEITAGKKYKQKRLHFGGMGRRFRLTIETNTLTTDLPWRLIGGIHIIAEIDKD